MAGIARYAHEVRRVQKLWRAAASERMSIGTVTGAISAALAAIVLTILAAMYLIPYGVIVCGGIPVNPPEVTAGDAAFRSEEHLILTVTHDRAVYIGPRVFRESEVAAELTRARLDSPASYIELRADRRLTLHDLAPTLAAIREAGYSSFRVNGRVSSVLEISSRTAN